MINKSIGSTLKNSRISNNLSLSEISNALHIKENYLRALENDEFEILPSDTQGRGFLRLYCEYLNIDPFPLLNTWISQKKQTEEFFFDSKKSSNNGILYKDNNVTEVTNSTEINKKSELIFKDIGRQLFIKRETLGISIEDVERFTHVRAFYLNALEHGDMEIIPSSVQGRGMLKNYLSFLGMDVESYMLMYAEGLQERLKENQKNSVNINKIPEKVIHKVSHWQRLLTPDMMIGTSVILLLLIFGIWSLSKVISLRSQQIEILAPSISEVLNDKPTVPSSNLENIDRFEITQQEISEANGSDNQSVNTILLGTATLPVLDSAPLQIYIVPKQRAYLQVIADQKEIFNGRVGVNTPYQFSGYEKIELITGNLAALDIFFNGNDIDELSEVGQMKNLLFTIDGIITPTSQFSLTASTTLEPTITTIPDTITPTPTVTLFIP